MYYAFDIRDYLWWMHDCGMPVITGTRLQGKWPPGVKWHAYDAVKNEIYRPTLEGVVQKMSWKPSYTHLRALLLWCKQLDSHTQKLILGHMGPEPRVSHRPLLWPVWYPGPKGQQTRSWPALEQRDNYQWSATENRFVRTH